jgi:hypothetical protein
VTTVAEKIANRAYWVVRIRPAEFINDRVPFKELEPIISRCAVTIRGWDVPHVDVHELIESHEDFIAQSFDWEHHVETWRFYQSGQFVMRKGMRLAWRSQSGWFKDSQIPDHDVVGISDTVGHFAEVFELAARLAVTPAGGEEMVIEASARNLADHHLYLDSPGRATLYGDYVTHIEDFGGPVRVHREYLVANKDELALDAAEALLSRFSGFSPSRDVLRSLRDEFR